jgi:hypothetical protein
VVRANLGFGRDRLDVAGDLPRQRLEALLEQQLEPVDHQVFVAADVHRRTPLHPAVSALAHRVERDAQQADHDRLHGLILTYNWLSYCIAPQAVHRRTSRKCAACSARRDWHKPC